MSDGPIKKRMKEYWQANPASLSEAAQASGSTGDLAFYSASQQIKYSMSPEVPGHAKFNEMAGRRVLEVGCGVGVEAGQFARHGARYTGIDLGYRQALLTSRHLKLLGVPGSALNADASKLPFASDSFDRVWSLGVIHHTPDTEQCVSEMWRVLKSGGEIALALYHRNSVHYRIYIQILGTLAVLFYRLSPAPVKGWLDTVRPYIGRVARRRDLPLNEALLASLTDSEGDLNPLSKVYSAKEMRALLNAFEDIQISIHPIGNTMFGVKWVAGNPAFDIWARTLGRRFGWFIYAHARKPKT